MSLTIQLDDATAEVVQELAATQHRSADEVVRAALSAFVQTGQRVLPKAVGKEDSKFSEHIDRELNRLARLPPNWDAEELESGSSFREGAVLRRSAIAAIAKCRGQRPVKSLGNVFGSSRSRSAFGRGAGSAARGRVVAMVFSRGAASE